MAGFIKRLDPRLSAELRGQRKPILKGLICVVITSLLTSATIPLIRASVAAIENATPVKTSRSQGPSLSGSEQAAENQPAAPKTDASRSGALRALGWLSLLIVLLHVVKYGFTRGQMFYISEAAARLAADLRLRMFRKLQRLPIAYFNERRTGAIQSVLTNDVTVYQSAIMIVRDSIDAPVKAFTAFAYVLYMQWQLAVVAVLFMPALALVIQHNGRRMRHAQAKVQEDLSDLSAMTQEAIVGTRVVKAFAAEERVAANYKELVKGSLRSQLRAAKRLSSLKPSVELLGAGAMAGGIYLCGWLAFQGEMRVADIAALIFAMDVINQGFRTWGYVNNTYNQVQAASSRIYKQVLDIEEEHATFSGSETLLTPSGRLEFQNVSFVYPDGTAALKDVSFAIEPGTSLALVGPSGAGKSTIADLALRFYDPTGGRVLFDGVDLKDLDVTWYRSLIGVVPQQNFLFAGTISENIRLGAPSASEAEVMQAARMAHASDFIHRMPEAFETELGERGVRISGGEMQRIAIARALVRKPTLLLLDEATSNLDSVSEKAVQEALDDSMRGRTTLFIAHRLTTAARADKILVLRHGEMVEYGSHRELMDLDGAYAGMMRAFQSGVMDDPLLDDSRDGVGDG